MSTKTSRPPLLADWGRTHRPPIIEPAERRCDPAEAAGALGYRRVRTIYELIRSGQLPAVKLPGSNRWRILVTDIAKLNRGESLTTTREEVHMHRRALRTVQ